MKKLILLLALACAAPLVTTSCQTRVDPAGAYAGNANLYATDASITAAFQVLDVFIKFQFENRASLPANINAFADKTRREAPTLSKRILALRDAYAASPTPQGKASLDTVLRLLREAVVQASAYLVETQPTP